MLAEVKFYKALPGIELRKIAPSLNGALKKKRRVQYEAVLRAVLTALHARTTAHNKETLCKLLLL